MTRHVSRSRAIAIANPNLSRSALAALRKKERRSDEDREKQLRRFDDAIPTARKGTGWFPGGEPWHWAPRGKQAVACKGFPIPVGKGAKRVIHGLSEDAAQREILLAALARVGGDLRRLPPDQFAAAAALSDEQQRKFKRGMRARAK